MRYNINTFLLIGFSIITQEKCNKKCIQNRKCATFKHTSYCYYSRKDDLFASQRSRNSVGAGCQLLIEGVKSQTIVTDKF